MRPIAFEVSGLLTRQPTGVATYGSQLVSALLERRRYDYVLAHPWRRWRRRRHASHLDARFQPYGGGRLLAREAALLHALDTRLPRRYRGPLVATLFDLLSALPLSAAAGFSSSRFRRKKMRTYHEIATRAQVIITLSETVAGEIRARLTPSGEVIVVPPGIAGPTWSHPPADAEERLARCGMRRPYLLCVGALCTRKNIGAALSAFTAARRHHPEVRLVVIGEPSYGWEGSAAEAALAALRRESPATVCLAGYVPRAVLWEAYAHAEGLLYLSHYEGYGLPVLEAQWAGTPVVCSRRGGIVDAAGEHAWLVEPDRPAEVARALEDVLHGGAHVRARVAAARGRARAFSWETVAERIEGVYERTLASARE